MLTLVLTACLVGEPARCEEKYFPLDVPMMQCVLHAQQFIARWNEEHPDWTVTRHVCVPAGQLKQKA